MKPKLDFPYLSEISVDLLTKLLEKDPTKRLGNTEAGLQEIRNHRWFESINWDNMSAKLTDPPYKPILENSTDTRHFTKDFTSMKLSP